MTTNQTIMEQYQEWRRTPAGQRIATEAASRAKRLRRAGVRRYGIGAIAESIRFDHAVRVGHDAQGFKLNNNFRALLARELMASYAELDRFFETRRRTSP